MRILSVNVGNSQPVTIKSKTLQTGIYKIPASGPVMVSRLGLKDDVRIEPRKMGLEHSAVYAYPFEHYAYWQEELGREEAFPMGQFGENLTVTGLLEEEVRIGDIFRFGHTVLQVAHPRIPCAKLNTRMGLRFAPMFLASRKVGYYFRVLEEGTVEQGDSIELLERDEVSPTMEEFVRVAHYEYWDAEGLKNLLKARDLMPAWRETIESKLTKAQSVESGWHGVREFTVVGREQESENTVSLDLVCTRGRALPTFRGGQKLMVVLGGRGGDQQRRACYLSSSPKALDTYRITTHIDSDKADATKGCAVTSHLSTLNVGEHILCTAAHGLVRSLPEEGSEERLPLLISQGQGIAPILSMLYELQGRQLQVTWFHESAKHEPQGLLNEARKVIDRNPGFEMVTTSCDEGEPDQLTARMISEYIELGRSNIELAGSRDFVERMITEFMALNISPGALVTFNVD